MYIYIYKPSLERNQEFARPPPNQPTQPPSILAPLVRLTLLTNYPPSSPSPTLNSFLLCGLPLFPFIPFYLTAFSFLILILWAMQNSSDAGSSSEYRVGRGIRELLLFSYSTKYFHPFLALSLTLLRVFIFFLSHSLLYSHLTPDVFLSFSSSPFRLLSLFSHLFFYSFFSISFIVFFYFLLSPRSDSGPRH